MKTKHLEVIDQFKKGFTEGLTILYEAYGRYLFQYSIKNWSLDEDESYEVLYKTLETVGKVINRYEFTSESHFSNWLFKIHKNNILVLIRSKKAKDAIVLTMGDWLLEAQDSGYENPELDVGEIESLSGMQLYEEDNANNPLFAALEKALQMVSQEERDILLLRMNNYSYEDISKMIKIENNQLKVKFSRAKAKVQKITMNILKETSNEKV